MFFYYLKMSTKKIPLWKRVLRQNFTQVDQLAKELEMDASLIDASRSFVLNLPRRLACKIEKGNQNDPLFLQFVPMHKERELISGFVNEPVSDSAFRCGDRLLQKYQGRALLVMTSACAMHCRYCFRQNFDYLKGDRQYSREVDIIANDPSIREVILSGGDPLSLDDSVLFDVLRRLDAIEHVRALRIHSRFVVGIPERIDDAFIEELKKLNTQVWFVVHINHEKELDCDVVEALGKVRKLGIPVLNQAVLLKGVNDTVEAQVKLSLKLTDCGVQPYYLHQLDRVQGAAHFEVSVERGKELIVEMAKELPGYAVPRYVQEIPHEPNKTRIL